MASNEADLPNSTLHSPSGGKTKAFRLLDLPPEIRLRIYEFAYDEAEIDVDKKVAKYGDGSEYETATAGSPSHLAGKMKLDVEIDDDIIDSIIFETELFSSCQKCGTRHERPLLARRCWPCHQKNGRALLYTSRLIYKESLPILYAQTKLKTLLAPALAEFGKHLKRIGKNTLVRQVVLDLSQIFPLEVAGPGFCPEGLANGGGLGALFPDLKHIHICTPCPSQGTIGEGTIETVTANVAAVEPQWIWLLNSCPILKSICIGVSKTEVSFSGLHPRFAEYLASACKAGNPCVIQAFHLVCKVRAYIMSILQTLAEDEASAIEQEIADAQGDVQSQGSNARGGNDSGDGPPRPFQALLVLESFKAKEFLDVYEFMCGPYFP